jgi:APA family basic amino acid/polyamine antiporter
MIGVLWAYEGWQYITFSAGETKDPQRVFPLGIGIGTALLIGIYVLANIGYIAALGADGAMRSERIAAESMAALFGPAAGKVIAAIILVSMFSAANGLTLTAPRLYYSMSRDGVFFAKVAEVHPRFRTPIYALLLMTVPSIVVSALWAYWPTFRTLVLDATLVIAVTYLGSALGATLLPYIKPDLYRASPIFRYRIAGLPMITVAGAIFSGFLVFNLYLWFKDAVYGVNNSTSLIFMGIMYLLAILIYVVARIYRRRQGIDLRAVHEEIPVE